MSQHAAGRERIGLVDGSTDANSRRFRVVLDKHAVVQLDDLIAVTQSLPDGSEVVHYGIVVETTRHIEGAHYASDTAHIDERTMPGETARLVDVQVLRTDPELWLSPEPGMVVRRAMGAERNTALFVDKMSKRLPVGLDQSGAPIEVDLDFVDGTRGAHVNISGISGVATKTTYALFFLYMLLESEQGQRALGVQAANTRALVFNVKSEDLLFLDRPNAKLSDEARERWRALGVEPGPFKDVTFYSPRAAGATGTVVPDVRSRDRGSVVAYGWTPWDFIRQGLLQFLFTDDDDRRTQVGFVEQQVRIQLARHAHPLEGDGAGAVVLRGGVADNVPYDFQRVVESRRDALPALAGTVVRDFGDLIEFLERKLIIDNDAAWHGTTQPNTVQAFIRRLFSMRRRAGHLISTGVTSIDLERSSRVSVVDISRLHQSAQRFVVAALLDRVWDSKQGAGREPLRFIVLDELNKYVPRGEYSPLKELLIDIAERGRALGVILVGAQQAATEVDPAIVRNASVKVVGRLDALEAGEYRFLTPELRERATRFLPGTMVLDQPLVPAPIPLRFPFPGFATNPEEGRLPPADAAAAEAELLSRIGRR